MPYAVPTSPIPSPIKEAVPSRSKGWITPPSHIEEIHAGPSMATGPMPGIPRRSSSSSTTPRRGMSPSVSRQPSVSHHFAASRPMEGLPRRLSNGHSALGVSGLPAEGQSSLGLKLHPSPVKSRSIPVDPMSSTSTMDSSLPPTPADEIHELPLPPAKTQDGVPFPVYEPHQPLPHNAKPARSALSPRPTLFNSRRSSGSGHRRSDSGSGSATIGGSSSATHLHHSLPSTESFTFTPRPASMIRKKSGEVVKPSLKQRSMSTPDLSRQNNRSGDDSPDHEGRDFGDERSKSVRFADADDASDGKALESVVLFLREQKVTAIGRAADPSGHYTETETENDTDAASDFVQFRTRRNAAARQTDNDKLVLEGGSHIPRIRVDFSPDSRGALKDENILLERVELLADSGPLQLKGSAIARNVAFQKWVAIRFTLDNWQTVSEVSGNHVTHIPADTTGDEGWDRFTFSIKLEDYKRKLEERQLIMCIRFSVDGREWWDSNDGMNYNLTFKKAAPRRPLRLSGPAAFGNLGRSTSDSTPAANLPGLRQNRAASSTATQISKAFGAPESRAPTGPRNWAFPRLAAGLDGPITRPESPVSTPPPQLFKPPNVPDVHSHLSLSRYCAPSPPTSPPKEQEFSIPTAPPAAMMMSPESVSDMALVGGQLATLSRPLVEMKHERRGSWNGTSESWSSFSQALSSSDGDTPHATDGETTPVAMGSRSPLVTQSSSDSSPEHRPLKMKRSTGDLRALITDDLGLSTPPSSNLSSPPSPAPSGLPEISMSPSPSSSTSTGASSPDNTIRTDSAPDLSNLAIHIDPDERGRTLPPKMLSNSYQEFLDRFCFFKSPPMTPTPAEDNYFTRPSYIPISGTVSPNGGFPFFTSNASSSPRNTPTPTKQYDSASDAFAFIPGPSPARSPSTRSPNNGLVNGTPGQADGDVDDFAHETPKATPALGNSPEDQTPLGQFATAYPAEAIPWNRIQPNSSPMATAQ